MGLKKIWENKRQIGEGIWNSVFTTEYIENIVEKRKAICESNVCGFYDKNGSSPKAVIPGRPACGICGCEANLKQHCLSCECTLVDLGLTPLWSKEMTEEEERDFDAKKK